MKIIAEIGVNHNGKLSKAKELIKIAKKGGALFVKFQLFKTENLVTRYSSSAKYQKKINKNQFKLLKKYEISIKDFKRIYEYCKKLNIKLLTTCFDIETFKNVNKNFKFDTFKIGSGDLNNLPLIYEIAKNKKN